MKHLASLAVAAILTSSVSCALAAGTEVKAKPQPRRIQKSRQDGSRASATGRKPATAPKVRSATNIAKVGPGAAATNFLSATREVVPPTLGQIAALKAEAESERKIAGYVKVGDLASALAECRSAMDASAAAWGGVASPRLRHLLGATYLAGERYAEAYRIFGDIGRHNGEVYACGDFDMDVALAAVHVGNPGQAEILVRRYLSRFDPTSFIGNMYLLPGFATPAAALATVHTARGSNFLYTGRDEEARVELNLAAQLAPNNAYIAEQRGTALEFTGYFGQARACLEVAMRSEDPVLKMTAAGELRNVFEAEAKSKAGGGK